MISQQEDQFPGQHWPQAWRTGVIVPLWKKKGDRKNKNTWRGITLLSVGSKVVARICALRLSRWCAPWLNKMQFGFRAGSGIDDIQQLSRRLLEEAAQSQHPHTYLFRFYDLEKAYPKVVRHGLWQLLELKGCPRSFLRILQAIHDSSSSKVKFQGLESSSFTPGRGLREGCPSSPILFNIFHSGVMEVFRKRRERVAATAGHTAGIPWVYKVDGRVAKRKTDREEVNRNIKRTRFGDMAYADDTAIMGVEQEVLEAEPILIRTIQDFDGKVNEGKTEGLRVAASPNVELKAELGESHAVKHVGAVLSDRAHHVQATAQAVTKGIGRVEAISKAWLGGPRNRQRRHDLKKSVRVKVLKAVVKGILHTFSRTRAWQTNHIHRMQTVIHVALRRVLGVRTYHMRRHGISNLVLRKLAQWEPFESAVRRASLLWLGHVARMSVDQPQKQAIFGWIEDACGKERCPFKQAQWINSCLYQAGISEIDWFRVAQNRSEWRHRILTAFPPEVVDPLREREFNGWKVGDPIPQWARPTAQESREREYEHSEDELGAHRHGPQAEAESGSYGRERNPRRDRRQPRPPGQPQCPVCHETFAKSNQLAFHYAEKHAICSPEVTTVQSFTCDDCHQTFRRAGQKKEHQCPAKRMLPRLQSIDTLEQVGGPSRELADPITATYHLFTDGSGGDPARHTIAGWGVGVFSVRRPRSDLPWLAALYGPVITAPYDPLWLGARKSSNNTAEVTAIGEACRWLLALHEQLPPNHPRKAIIFFDSHYAYGVSTRLTKATDNMDLVDKVASLVVQVRQFFTLTFEHVKGHTGIYGNEVADRLADRGSQGRVSPHSHHWVTPPAGPMGHPPPPPAPKRNPRPRAMRRPEAAPGTRHTGGWNMMSCPLCQKNFRSCDLPQHQPTCRGPGDANLKCQYCQQVYGSIGARKNHEKFSHPAEALRDGLITSIPKRARKQQVLWLPTLSPLQGLSRFIHFMADICGSLAFVSVPTRFEQTARFHLLVSRWMTSTANERKRKMEALSKQVEEHATALAQLTPRVDRLEEKVEQAEAYRYLRVEHSVVLGDLFGQIESGNLQKKELRKRTEEGLAQEVKTVLCGDTAEDKLQQKSDELSRGNRTWDNKETRTAEATAFSLAGLVDWVQKQGPQGWGVRLKHGEASRAQFQRVVDKVNWYLRVHKEVAVSEGQPSPVQVYQDRGPWQRFRANNKGTDKGKGNKGQGNKGRGKGGKGKGKGNKGKGGDQ
eukprot:Skav209387  [mRNA]  locus=scaffold3334:137441:141157:+ [translate_table: standard]